MLEIWDQTWFQWLDPSSNKYMTVSCSMRKCKVDIQSLRAETWTEAVWLFFCLPCIFTEPCISFHFPPRVAIRYQISPEPSAFLCRAGQHSQDHITGTLRATNRHARWPRDNLRLLRQVLPWWRQEFVQAPDRRLQRHFRYTRSLTST